MTILDTPVRTRPEVVDACARRFVEGWYRKQGPLADGFDRFVSAHRVPAEMHEDVRERAQELLLGAGAEARPS